jgi:hypothetical protein
MLCPLAPPLLQPLHRPIPPAPPRQEDSLPHGSGWFLSSYELRRGVTVVELAPGEVEVFA